MCTSLTNKKDLSSVFFILLTLHILFYAMKQTLLYRLGGSLMVIGSILPLFTSSVAPFVFAAGALLFGYTQIADRYEGKNFVIRRLRRQQVMGALLLIVTAYLMLSAHFQWSPFRGHEWQVTLMIAAFLELYTTFRIDHESKK